MSHFEANPFIIEITFTDLKSLNGLDLVIGDTEMEALVRLYSSSDASPVEFTFKLDSSVQEPKVSVDFDQTYLVKTLYLELRDLRQGEPGHVHLWELIFR